MLELLSVPILLLPILLKMQQMHSQGATQLTKVSHRTKKGSSTFSSPFTPESTPLHCKKKNHFGLCVTLVTISSQPLPGIPSFYLKCRMAVRVLLVWLDRFLFGCFFGPAPSRNKCAGHYRRANVEQLTNSQIFQAAQANCLYFPFEEIKIRY